MSGTETTTEAKTVEAAGKLYVPLEGAEGESDTNGQQKPAESKPTLLDQQKTTDAGKTQVTPEKYEFKAPEGAELSEGVLSAYSEVAKKLNLSQEAAQSVIDGVIPAMQSQAQARMEAARNEWAEASRTDKDFGGDKLDANLGIAKKALDKFGSPALREMLRDTGLGNHPEVIRLLLRAGHAISEDKIVPSRTESTAAPDQSDPEVIASRIYGKKYQQAQVQ